MMDATPIETPAPAPVEAPAAPANDVPVPSTPLERDDTSEQSASEPTPGGVRDHMGRYRRHRALSQQARSEDVPRIKELTGKWREAEKREQALRAEFEELKKRVPAAPEPTKAIFTPPPAAPSAYDKPEPTLEDFKDAPDPYLSLTRAAARYDRDKDAHEQAQSSHGQTTAQYEQQRQQAVEQIKATYQQRLNAFAAKTPDFDAVAKSAPDRPIPPLGNVALQLADNGPELVYAILKNHVLADELYLLTVGKPVTDDTVAMTQRWLAARVQAVMPPSIAGSAAAVPHTPAPRPPNPVRTGAMKTSDDLPGDSHSIMDHVKHFRRR